MSIHRGAGSSSSVSRTPSILLILPVTLSPPSGWDAEFSERGTIADQVRNSQAYKTAYKIFFSVN